MEDSRAFIKDFPRLISHVEKGGYILTFNENGMAPSAFKDAENDVKESSFGIENEITEAGINTDTVSPKLLPDYTKKR